MVIVEWIHSQDLWQEKMHTMGKEVALSWYHMLVALEKNKTCSTAPILVTE